METLQIPQPALQSWTRSPEFVTFTIERGPGPVVAAAVHDGHDLRPEVAARLRLSDAERRREEDPLTACWTTLAATRIVALRSRFEVDFNRQRDQAVYVRPEDAWGLDLWVAPPSAKLIQRSLAQYDAFYAALEEVLSEKVRRCGSFVLYDLHSYNHRRDGACGTPADPGTNPEVNVGTGTMDRELWGPVVDRFVSDMRSVEILGRCLDVRENVRFRGGELAAWTHRTFPGTGCALAIELKKIFMDEWTGEPYLRLVEAIGAALNRAARGTEEVLATR